MRSPVYLTDWKHKRTNKPLSILGFVALASGHAVMSSTSTQTICDKLLLGSLFLERNKSSKAVQIIFCAISLPLSRPYNHNLISLYLLNRAEADSKRQSLWRLALNQYFHKFNLIFRHFFAFPIIFSNRLMWFRVLTLNSPSSIFSCLEPKLWSKESFYCDSFKENRGSWNKIE